MALPEPQKSKKELVRSMFNDIAFRYDFLNHFLSLGIDIQWRRKVRKYLSPFQPKQIIDVATGTGDLAIELNKLNPDRIIGIDIAAEMLAIGKEKLIKKQLTKIELQKGDSEKIDFTDNTFDAVTVAFGVRNFENLNKGLSEMCRVLKPGGHVAVLEFSKPKSFPFKQAYNTYFKYLLPGFGKLISKNNQAYTYLPQSVEKFYEGEAFLNEMKKAGFSQVEQKRLTYGIATLYTGMK
jgi:demethylmenaquinone methyltransferase / 2-methoxy-6-polyprenyl-1,4-benzoquinol methylase